MSGGSERPGEWPGTSAVRSVRLRITGRVQGVGYRAWALQLAGRLGLRGWVRNRADGSVEALAIGEDEAVARIIEACREGPFGAHVSDVAISDAEDDGSSGFTAKPTL
jgi:acylphosphatase